MKISIITVCFNAASTVKDTLDSVNEQDYNDVEHIIVDGGSNDRTIDIVLSGSQRITSFVSEPDRGIYDAMNKGVAKESGEIVGILNADDYRE